MNDYFFINNNETWDIADVPEQYTEKSSYVVNRMRNVLITYFKDEDFPIQDVKLLLQYAYELNHIISVLKELQGMRENGHEMCLEDSVYGIIIMNQLKMQKEKAMKVWIALREVTKNDKNPFSIEIGITHQMKEPDLSSEMRQYVTSIWMIYEKIMQWIESCTKSMDSMILFFTQDCEIYHQFFIKGYRDYWQMYQKVLSDRLLTGLYREDTFGEKILSMGKKPDPEHWGRALELKLAKLKEDPTFSFMEKFHRADKMFELTVPSNLPDIVRNRIGMSMHKGEIDDLSFDRNIHVFYRHMAEINILKMKMEDDNNLSMDTSLPEKDKKKLAHFPACRNYTQSVAILEHLKEKGFVEKNTEPKNFLWQMGCTEERPDKVKPIVWLKTKQLLREMLEQWFGRLLQEQSLNKVKIESLCSQIFIDKQGDMIHLPKNKPYPSADSDDLKVFFATI